MNTDFKDKIVLVTGASSGIGRAIVSKLAESGACLILMGRDPTKLEKIKQTGKIAECLCVRADLENPASLTEPVNELWNWKGRLDGIAYCAGIGLKMRLRDTTLDLMQSRMMVHCFAFVELVRKLARLKKKDALLQVVAISSLAARGQEKYFTAYAASKGALEAAAKTMAAELLPRKILINLIRCAFVDTPMITGPIADPTEDFILRLAESGAQPLGIIPPDIAAESALFLLGPGGMYSTGTTLTINAGAKI